MSNHINGKMSKGRLFLKKLHKVTAQVHIGIKAFRGLERNLCSGLMESCLVWTAAKINASRSPIYRLIQDKMSNYFTLSLKSLLNQTNFKSFFLSFFFFLPEVKRKKGLSCCLKFQGSSFKFKISLGTSSKNQVKR